MVKTSAIIMAAGFSRRMGQNKLFLEFQGKTFLQHVLDLVLACDFYERILVISPENAEKIQIPAAFKVVYNRQAHHGQSVSVRMGTIVASGEGYLYLTGDQPLLNCGTIEAVLKQGAKDKIVYPKNLAGKPGSPVFFGKKFRSELLHLEGDMGGKKIRQEHLEDCYGVIVPDDHVLMDVDTPEAYDYLLNLPATVLQRMEVSDSDFKPD